MKNMRAVFVDVDSFDIFRINISRNMSASVYHETGLPPLRHFIGKNGPEKTCANNQIIIMFHNYFTPCLIYSAYLPSSFFIFLGAARTFFPVLKVVLSFMSDISFSAFLALFTQ